MLAPLSINRPARTLEFGLYRDGDNNLDTIQAQTIAQAAQLSERDRRIEFTVEDTTARRGFEPAHTLRTESYTIADGAISRVTVSRPHDPSSRENLTRFVAQTLDRAQQSNARETWLDLIDHGAGDGGGLEADHGSGIMRADDIAGAIADGVALHAREHPADAGRGIDGVVANQCLMATVAFSDALSHAGVKFLAASPETMLAPGVPTQVAGDIADHVGDPTAMARAVVDRTMSMRYGTGKQAFAPAAAFDVIDLEPAKMANVERGVQALDAALVRSGHDASIRSAVREDAKAIAGMVRFPHHDAMPWTADRPATALYRTLAHDGRLPGELRTAAATAADAIAATVLAHRETDDFTPFGGADYSDAAGPTVHFPVAARQVDPWAPQVSETDNAFYRTVDEANVARVFAQSANARAQCAPDRSGGS